jgi:hypothetical protein
LGDYSGEKRLLDTHLVANLKRDATKGYFDGQHQDGLLYVGFYFGALHGCLLSQQTGQIRPHVTTLITCSHPDAAKGYYVGRRERFMNISIDERIYTDNELLEELSEIAQDMMDYPDEENSWYYSIGCMLGNMSGRIFPATSEECQQWEEEYRRWKEEYEQDTAKVRESESVQPIALQEA